MKYDIGDSVTIKDIDWYNKLSGNSKEKIYFHSGEILFAPDMSKYCGVTTRIFKFSSSSSFYNLECDNGFWAWSDEMFEDVRKIRKRKLKKLYEVK